MRELRLLVLLARPAVVLLLALFTAIGLAQAGQGENRVLLAQAFAAVLSFILFSIAINDLADVQIDRVNLAGDPRRPLVTGSGTSRDLVLIAGASAMTSLGFSAVLGWPVLLTTVAGIVVSAGYSLRPVRLADRGVVASLVLPACYVAVPNLIGMFSARHALRSSDLLLLAGLYLGFIARILLKDFRDVRGDALFGKRTFLVRHGRVWTCRFSAVAWSGGTALLLLAIHGSAALIASYAAGTVATVLLLRALSHDRGPRRDETIISALALVGRGLLISLLAALAMTQANWAMLTSAAVIAVLALITAAEMMSMLRHGPHSRLALVQAVDAPWTTPSGSACRDRCLGHGVEVRT
ncbi:MAG: UbiA family prenyltransferase [Pseudonocardiales bacterium]